MPLILFKKWLHGKNWRYIHETIEEKNDNICWFIHKKRTYSFTITNDENNILQVYFYIYINVFLKSSKLYMKICTSDLNLEKCYNMVIVHNGSLHINDIL